MRFVVISRPLQACSSSIRHFEDTDETEHLSMSSESSRTARTPVESITLRVLEVRRLILGPDAGYLAGGSCSVPQLLQAMMGWQIKQATTATLHTPSVYHLSASFFSKL